MRKYNTIFLDRDGTLNPDPGYISSLDQFEFYDFTIPALQRLRILGIGSVLSQTSQVYHVV